jgi:hypothetical protein
MSRDGLGVGHRSVYQPPWRPNPHVFPNLRLFPVAETSPNLMPKLCRVAVMEPAAVWTITFHVLELVAVAVVLLLYLLIKVWRRI